MPDVIFIPQGKNFNTGGTVASFSTTSDTFVDTGLTVTIRVSGFRPVLIYGFPTTGTGGRIAITNSSSSDERASSFINVVRDGSTTIFDHEFVDRDTRPAAGWETTHSCSTVLALDDPGEGSFTYKCQVRALNSDTILIEDMFLRAVEL